MIEVEARIRLKSDTATNWSTQNPQLLDGELIAVQGDGIPRLKIGDGTSGYNTLEFLDQDMVDHIASTSNPHGVTKAQVGLGNVDNTADSAKSVNYAATAGSLTNLTATVAELNKLDGVTATTAEINKLDGLTATTTELNYVDGVTSNIQTQLNGKSDHDHTHSYAGSSSVGGAATSANKLNTNAGTINQPVYFSNGVPVVCGVTIEASVPADAVFTDTVYTLPNATTSTLGGVKVGTNISVSSGTISVANGSTSAKGVVQLTSATNSTSTSLAATASAVKAAYDLANAKQSPATTISGYGITDAYTKSEVDTKVAGLVDSAPEALNTLNELAAALGDDPNFATTVSTEIGKKANTADLAAVATSGAYSDLSGVPTSLPANGGNAATVGGFTVGTNVPANAVFTDTKYTLSSFGITATAAELNKLDGITATTAELNKLDGVTATTAELNYCDGVTSNIQTQLNGKLSTSGTAAKATADASGNNIASTYETKANAITGLSVSGTTITYTKGNGNTGTITTQDTNTTYSAATTSAAGLMSAADKTKLNGIATGANAYSLPTASSSTLGGVKTTSTVTSTSGLTACPIISGVPYYKDTNNTYTLSSFGITATAAELNKLDGVTATTAELNFCDGVTSNIQTQLNGKLSTSGTAAKATADASGNNIASTYATKATAITGLSVSGKVITYTKGNGSTGTITTQDTNTTYDAMSASEATTGTATTARTITAKVLNDKIASMLPAVTKVTFTATDSRWGSLSNGKYPLTIAASGGEFLNCYRTNGSVYDKTDVSVSISGDNIIIYSLDKFAGYITYL